MRKNHNNPIERYSRQQVAKALNRSLAPSRVKEILAYGFGELDDNDATLELIVDRLPFLQTAVFSMCDLKELRLVCEHLGIDSTGTKRQVVKRADNALTPFWRNLRGTDPFFLSWLASSKTNGKVELKKEKVDEKTQTKRSSYKQSKEKSQYKDRIRKLCRIAMSGDPNSPSTNTAADKLYSEINSPRSYEAKRAISDELDIPALNLDLESFLKRQQIKNSKEYAELQRSGFSAGAHVPGSDLRKIDK
jgi:hypothetical protein